MPLPPLAVSGSGLTTAQKNISEKAKDPLQPATMTAVPPQEQLFLSHTTKDGSCEEVRKFLVDIKLEKYYDKFMSSGVEDMETILEMKDKHIEQMGIPLGHKLKIIKKIKDLRMQKGMAVTQQR